MQQFKESQGLIKATFWRHKNFSRIEHIYTQANAFATVCINSHQNVVSYSFTQSSNMNSTFLYILIIQRLRELFQIHGFLTMKLEIHGE